MISAPTDAEEENKFMLTMEFEINARNTSYGEKDNSVWLMKAGFLEAEVIQSLRACFKQAYSYRPNKFVCPTMIPEEDQPWH